MYYILESSREHVVFNHSMWHLCGGQDHENLPQLVAFRIRPGATDCGWPTRSVIPSFVNGCIYTHCFKLMLVLFSSQTRYIHTEMQCVDISIQHCNMNSCLQKIHNWVSISIPTLIIEQFSVCQWNYLWIWLNLRCSGCKAFIVIFPPQH